MNDREQTVLDLLARGDEQSVECALRIIDREVGKCHLEAYIADENGLPKIKSKWASEHGREAESMMKLLDEIEKYPVRCCEYCQKAFLQTHGSMKYCCPECAQRHRQSKWLREHSKGRTDGAMKEVLLQKFTEEDDALIVDLLRRAEQEGYTNRWAYEEASKTLGVPVQKIVSRSTAKRLIQFTNRARLGEAYQHRSLSVLKDNLLAEVTPSQTPKKDANLWAKAHPDADGFICVGRVGCGEYYRVKEGSTTATSALTVFSHYHHIE